MNDSTFDLSAFSNSHRGKANLLFPKIQTYNLYESIGSEFRGNKMSDIPLNKIYIL